MIENSIRDIINWIGDDPKREGLSDTPDRIIKSFEELYSGYRIKPDEIKKMLTQFDAESYDSMVLLKDIEFYSMCEHHMLPFFGRAHIAYIPNRKIVGISKLARLLEIFSRRLQIQERIGRQIIDCLDLYVEPRGSACIIEAQHFCMIARGVQKQNSIMVTSSINGVFKTKPEAREELMRLIK